jgi:fluoride exporter
VNAALWVGAGGAVGAMARYGLNASITRSWGDGFPYGVLIINVLGSLLAGAATAVLLQRMPLNDTLRLFIVSGFLGGFTTFSAFSLDVLKLVNAHQSSLAALYVLASVVLSVIAVFAGFMILKAALQ